MTASRSALSRLPSAASSSQPHPSDSDAGWNSSQHQCLRGEPVDRPAHWYDCQFCVCHLWTRIAQAAHGCACQSCVCHLWTRIAQDAHGYACQSCVCHLWTRITQAAHGYACQSCVCHLWTRIAQAVHGYACKSCACHLWTRIAQAAHGYACQSWWANDTNVGPPLIETRRIGVNYFTFVTGCWQGKFHLYQWFTIWISRYVEVTNRDWIMKNFVDDSISRTQKLCHKQRGND